MQNIRQLLEVILPHITVDIISVHISIVNEEIPVGCTKPKEGKVHMNNNRNSVNTHDSLKLAEEVRFAWSMNAVMVTV